jgi:tryptophan synthase beta chain
MSDPDRDRASVLEASVLEASDPGAAAPPGTAAARAAPAPRPVPHRPDPLGHFGSWGGRFVPEVLMPAVDELAAAFDDAMADPVFLAELDDLRRSYAGRPTALTLARRLSAELGLEVWLKREDLLHTGAHKLNNALGQQLLTRRMGKPRVIAETGAGQHGVATATVAALLGQDCVVYMGEEDTRRQHLNVVRMRLLGAEVRSVSTGTATLKDAVSEALRDWVESVHTTHYVIGSVVGPHPFPLMVREFQRVIGEEARAQIRDASGGFPELVVACVGGGSNAAGMFAPFVDDDAIRLVGVEAGGRGSGAGDNAASNTFGEPGVLHGARSYVLQDPDGQVLPTHSVSAGLDYPATGPEHAFWKDSGRIHYTEVLDDLALEGFKLLARTEGILPALEPSHAIAWLARAARDGEVDPGTRVLLCLSGRGDKDVETVAQLLGEEVAR